MIRVLDPEIFIAIDGKTARRIQARRRGREPLHLVAARASRRRLALGRKAVAAKSNEITAIPLLPAWLERAGPSVSTDAILGLNPRTGQSAIAEASLARGGDDLLALKANRPATFADVETFFRDPPPGAIEIHGTIDGGHGRIERP